MATIDTQTDYEIGRDNIQFLGLDVHNPVFAVASLTIIGFVGGVLAFRDDAAAAFNGLHAWLTSTFDWVFMGAGNLFVLFCLLLVATPLGRVRLGGPDARPDYSAWSWFAMLFAAGIGIGLMFFGVAEPIAPFPESSARGSTPPTPPPRKGWHSPPPSFTGACTRGRCSRWSHWRSPSPPTTSVCR